MVFNFLVSETLEKLLKAMGPFPRTNAYTAHIFADEVKGISYPKTLGPQLGTLVLEERDLVSFPICLAFIMY